MIATAAEGNPSVFRSEDDGGLLPWREVVEEYVKTAVEVENRWGNTKFLLAQLIPGKADVQKRCQQSKNYRQAVEILEMNDIYDRARDVDEKLGITERTGKILETAKRKNKSALAAGAAKRMAGSERPSDNANHIPLSERGVTAMPAMAA